MQAQLIAFIPEDRHLRLDTVLPEDFHPGEAEVIVRQKASVEQMNDIQHSDEKIKMSDEAPLSDDFFAWYDQQPPGPHSEEEIAAWICEEREAWGDD